MTPAERALLVAIGGRLVGQQRIPGATERLIDALAAAGEESAHQERRRSSADDVIAWAAEFSGTSVAKMTGKSRLRGIVYARWLAMWLLHHLLGWSSTQIAASMSKDHSTVFYALHRVDSVYPDLDDITARAAEDLNLD
jgi:chromosomal replication initiation ATPase DnaA